jgi:hypothetical protein
VFFRRFAAAFKAVGGHPEIGEGAAKESRRGEGRRRETEGGK